MKGQAKLTLVTKTTEPEQNRRATDKGCVTCAMVLMFIFCGLIWFPIFKLLSWLNA